MRWAPHVPELWIPGNVELFRTVGEVVTATFPFEFEIYIRITPFFPISSPCNSNPTAFSSFSHNLHCCFSLILLILLQFPYLFLTRNSNQDLNTQAMDSSEISPSAVQKKEAEAKDSGSAESVKIGKVILWLPLSFCSFAITSVAENIYASSLIRFLCLWFFVLVLAFFFYLIFYFKKADYINCCEIFFIRNDLVLRFSDCLSNVRKSYSVVTDSLAVNGFFPF